MNFNIRKKRLFLICTILVSIFYVIKITRKSIDDLKELNIGLSLNDIILNDPSWANIFNASKYQSKIKPEIILQTLKYMIQEVDEEDPKLIEFVKSLIYPPSTESLNLNDPNKVHYSQFGESSVVDQILDSKTNGFLVEAGALDGEKFSNSLFFERERNWTGILIEPVPTSFENLLKKKRKMYAINACIAKKTPLVAKFKMAIHESMSGRNSEMSLIQHYNIEGQFDFIYVPCFSLNTILKAIDVNRVDFFSLDLEGGEWDVLNSLDFIKIDFRFFLIEWFGDISKKENIVNFMVDKNYRLNYTDNANLYIIKN